jgi:DNA ligase-1
MMFTPAPQTVEGMFTKIKNIAKMRMSGATAMQKKVDTIKGIFVACRHSEAFHPLVGRKIEGWIG